LPRRGRRRRHRYRHRYPRYGSPYYNDPYYGYGRFYDPFYYDYGYGYGTYPYGLDRYYGRYPSWRDREGEQNRFPDAQTGNVQLRIEPRDVLVYVDGVLTARDGRSTLNLPAGRWRLEFVRPGYRTETVDVEVAQGVSVRVERRLERVSEKEVELKEFALGDTGEMRVDVRPADAIVYLDGRALGLARDIRDLPSLDRLPAGRHLVEGRRPGYEPARREVVISPVQPAVLSVALERE
jgi:hypothetical protein